MSCCANTLQGVTGGSDVPVVLRLVAIKYFIFWPINLRWVGGLQTDVVYTFSTPFYFLNSLAFFHYNANGTFNVVTLMQSEVTMKTSCSVLKL